MLNERDQINRLVQNNKWYIKLINKYYGKYEHIIFPHSYCHWTWRFRHIPIIGYKWYEMGGRIYRRPIKVALWCWWEWEVKPFFEKFI